MCYAQNEVGEFAVVRDAADSFVYVRSKPDAKSPIVDTLQNGFVFFCHQKQGNWMSVEHIENDNFVQGYIYKDRMKLLSSFKPIKNIATSENTASFSDSVIKIDIAQTDFIKSDHKFTYSKQNPGMVDAVDGKQMWGTDGNFPKKEYQSVTVKIGNETVRIPKQALENLYEPTLDYTSAYYDPAYDTLYIRAFNSDGAGAYGLVWVIENKKYKTRALAYPF